MNRTFKTFPAPERCSEKLAHWAMQDIRGFCFRGSGWGKKFGFNSDTFAGKGHCTEVTSLSEAADFVQYHDDFIVTHLSYDLKNQLEKLSSENFDRIQFPEFGLYVPFWTAKLIGTKLEIGWPQQLASESEAVKVYEEISNCNEGYSDLIISDCKPAVSKAQYLDTVATCQYHIQRGDIYQANICQEFSWQAKTLNPASEFNRGFYLNSNPFSVLYRFGEHYCISWSPERFLAFYDSSVTSQPMKGTAPRGATKAEDAAFFEQLKTSEKDRRENVMIVDMVRNDLSHFAVPGSVQAPELYAIEAYPRVHQMHSTVVAKLRPTARLFDVLLKAFPMGSMTGAPKIRAMQIIEELENTKRGLFSGTIGFITPEKNADFNVVIRSLLYNARTKSLSCHVGGGITAMSRAEAEYEEALVKFEPMRQLLEPLTVT